MKGKGQKVRRHGAGTGGGPPLKISVLNGLEERLLGFNGGNSLHWECGGGRPLEGVSKYSLNTMKLSDILGILK